MIQDPRLIPFLITLGLLGGGAVLQTWRTYNIDPVCKKQTGISYEACIDQARIAVSTP